jgi:hypothetical protein
MDEVGDSGGTRRQRNLWGLSGKYLRYRTTIIACCGSRSGIQCFLGSLLNPDTGSGISIFRILDPEAPTHDSESLSNNFLGKNYFYPSQFFSVPVNFVKFTAAKKGKTKIFSPIHLFVGSGVGKIRIRDQHPGSATLHPTYPVVCIRYHQYAQFGPLTSKPDSFRRN